MISWEDAKVLDKVCDKGARHIKESIWIRKISPNTMNRDEGARFLSHVYDPLLTVNEPSVGDQSSRRKKDQYASVIGWLNTSINHSDDSCRPQKMAETVRLVKQKSGFDKMNSFVTSRI